MGWVTFRGVISRFVIKQITKATVFLFAAWDVHLLPSKLTYRSGKRTICRSLSHQNLHVIGISLLHRGSSIWITVKMVEDHCSIAETLLSEMCTEHCKAIGAQKKTKTTNSYWDVKDFDGSSYLLVNLLEAASSLQRSSPNLYKVVLPEVGLYISWFDLFSSTLNPSEIWVIKMFG